MTPGRSHPGNAMPASRRPVARIAASKLQNQLVSPSVRPAEALPIQLIPGRGTNRPQAATPSCTSTPASKASPMAGDASIRRSIMAPRWRRAPPARPPKWNGTSRPRHAGSTGCSSTRTTPSPRRAASQAAAQPAGPAPITRSWTCRRIASVLPAVEPASITSVTGSSIRMHLHDDDATIAAALAYRIPTRPIGYRRPFGRPIIVFHSAPAAASFRRRA